MFYDQASNLRHQVNSHSTKTKTTKVIAITSGKGGVGKSNFTLNFALALSSKGVKTAILDADIGLANIDVLLGIASKYSLLDLIHSQKNIWDIMETGPLGLNIIAGGSALENMLDLKKQDVQYLLEQLLLLNEYFDTLLIDTGAGINDESLTFILSADEVFLVTTPEPTSITDAYSMIKILLSKKKDIKINLVINRVSNEQEAVNTANRLKMVTERFLDYNIQLLGYIYDDDAVKKAVKKQKPFYISFPSSKASHNIEQLVDAYTKQKNDGSSSYGVRSFLSKMTHLLRR